MAFICTNELHLNDFNLTIDVIIWHEGTIIEESGKCIPNLNVHYLYIPLELTDNNFRSFCVTATNIFQLLFSLQCKLPRNIYTKIKTLWVTFCERWMEIVTLLFLCRVLEMMWLLKGLIKLNQIGLDRIQRIHHHDFIGGYLSCWENSFEGKSISRNLVLSNYIAVISTPESNTTHFHNLVFCLWFSHYVKS